MGSHDDLLYVTRATKRGYSVALFGRKATWMTGVLVVMLR